MRKALLSVLLVLLSPATTVHAVLLDGVMKGVDGSAKGGTDRMFLGK